MEDYYRSCASIIVFRPFEGDGQRFEFLLLHKPRKRDDWQLPQGGQEGQESSEEAALRELKEEAGIEAKVVGKSTQVYQYDFPASYRRFRSDNVCGQRIEFTIALANSDESVQVDDHEIDGHVWIFPEQLDQYIRRKEYSELILRLYEEGKKLIIDN